MAGHAHLRLVWSSDLPGASAPATETRPAPIRTPPDAGPSIRAGWSPATEAWRAHHLVRGTNRTRAANRRLGGGDLSSGGLSFGALAALAILVAGLVLAAQALPVTAAP